MKFNCFECGTELEYPHGITRKDECDKCGADVRACKNCKFYDPNSYNECKEPQAENVREKHRSNFCDYFEVGNGAGGNTSRDDLMSAAEALFKKKD